MPRFRRLVVPGFVDTHIHFYEWALKRRDMALDDISCLEELLARVRQAAAEWPTGQWIMGQGWNETRWPVARFPTRQDLDAVSKDVPPFCTLRPAALNEVTGLNVVGLRRAGMGADERREEIARMLAGATITDEARAAAAQLLKAG